MRYHLSCYRVMVNSPGVLSGKNAPLVSEARLKWCPCLSVLSLYSIILYSYCIVHTLLISSLVIGIRTLSLGLNNKRGHTESKTIVTPDLGWNPTTYKVMSYYASRKPETHTDLSVSPVTLGFSWEMEVYHHQLCSHLLEEHVYTLE